MIRLLLFCLVVACAVSAQTEKLVKSVSLQPCEVPGAEEGKKEKALCGTHEVFENRDLKTGRRIALKIVVFPATGKNKAPDPLFYIPGGPGSSSTEEAPYVAQEFVKIRKNRDLVFVDQRGTGGSNPLNCDFFNPADPQSFLGHWNPPADVRKCRELLQPKADLRQYVTSIAMDDLDEVRAALGYQKINISGGSYGTRAALTYLKYHGENVRSMILQGLSPTNQYMPRDFAQHTQRALDGVLDECLANKDCRAAFPNIKADSRKVLERLKKGPVDVEVKDQEKMIRVKLSRDLAGEAVRYMLYQSGAAARIPLVLRLAAQGNFTRLAEAALYYRREIVATGANGLYLSITCAEDLAWVKDNENDAAAEKTFLGNYRLRQQKEACSLWPLSEIRKDYSTPTRSAVPILIISGQWDPVTPSEYGDTAAKHLENSLHVVVPSGGHGYGGLEGLECISTLATNFINSGSVKGLDSRCFSSIHRKGFVLK